MLRHYTIHSTEMTFRTLHFLLFVAILLLSTIVSADDIEEVKANNPPKVSGDGIYTESLQRGLGGLFKIMGKYHKSIYHIILSGKSWW
uniref:uncharacterized protein LOC105352540 isoform X2 n=1 Tax=Fragaria vesca subsp. vesca TaxID=101020 RepID=UPI0005CB5F76|nr:PREDICTED: uncharacterized protein LOC105352540 isoform X2 [Fragaria vesca subsp. vesca]